MAKSGPKLRRQDPVIRRLIERWENGEWTRVREQRPSDFDESGHLSECLRLLGPTRTVTVQTTEGNPL